MRVPQTVLDAIATHARQTSPNECCGLLIGDGRCIFEAVPTQNAAADPLRRYEISPVDYFAHITRCRTLAAHSGGAFAIIGAYHSHPRGACEPSPTDIEQAFDDFLFVIAGPVSETAHMEIRAYRLREGTLEAVELIVERASPRQ